MAKTIVITQKVRDIFWQESGASGLVGANAEQLDDALRAVIRHAEQNYAKHLKRMSPKRRFVPANVPTCQD